MFLVMDYMPLGDLERGLREIENSSTYQSLALSEVHVHRIIQQEA